MGSYPNSLKSAECLITGTYLHSPTSTEDNQKKTQWQGFNSLGCQAKRVFCFVSLTLNCSVTEEWCIVKAHQPIYYKGLSKGIYYKTQTQKNWKWVGFKNDFP